MLLFVRKSLMDCKFGVKKKYEYFEKHFKIITIAEGFVLKNSQHGY